MKLILMALVLASAAWATPIIDLTGGGSFAFSSGDGTSVNMSASGGDVSFSISTFWNGGFSIAPGTTAFGGIGGSLFSSGVASIGLMSSPFFTINLGDPGTLTLYDRVNGSILASTPVRAYVNITSETDHRNGPFLETSSGTFAIIPTPEPSTWLLTAVGLGLLWRCPTFRAAKQSRPQA